jgi:hypothetical protein
MKRIQLIFLFLGCAISAQAQSTTVSGTVTDQGSQAWFGGSYSFQLVPNPTFPNIGQYTWTGGALSQVISGALDGSGHYSQSIPSNSAILPPGSTWIVTFCPLATSSCSTTANTRVTGGTETINATPPAIAIAISSPGPFTKAYSDTEIISAVVAAQYYNLTSQLVRVCQTVVVQTCTVWANVGGSSTTLFSGVPAGSCTAEQTAVNTLTGDFYSCVGGAWIKVGPGGNPGVLVSPVITPNPLNLDVNVGFKGPNPYVDGTRFGMRAVSQNAVPAVPGITLSCTSGSHNVTISSASTFQNGDGVALYGCGPGTIAAPSAPTVAPSVLAAQTGLLLDVNGPTGATTYCYQLVARTYMGATNVSPETCTSTGPATLGLQTNTITSVSLANNVATYTTSAPHGLVQYAHVNIAGVATLAPGSTIVPFNGWFLVATVADNTHFTVNLLTDTRNGAVTAGTGGTVSYWNSIHITATETTNNYIYYVYGRVTGGTKTIIGAMWPQDTTLQGRLSDPTYLAFDDLGSPFTTFPNPPFYIPTTVPTVATNDMLATTILSGAGTTSLVLADNAGNTISGQTILFDDAVTFLAAAKAAVNSGAGTAGPLMIPMDGSGYSFVFNSPISIGSGATNKLIVLQKGNIWLNEPITTSNLAWYGQPAPLNGTISFANQVTPTTIYFGKVSPGFFAVANTYFYDMTWFLVNTNGALEYIQEAGGIPASGAFRNVTFVLSTGTSYSNMAAVFRGNGNGDGWDFTNTTITSTQAYNIIGTTPALYFDLDENVRFNNLTLSGVTAAAFRPNPAGGFLLADNVYCQACQTPLFSLVRHPTIDPAAIFGATIRQTIFDTTTNSFLIANYGGHNLTFEAINTWGWPISGSVLGNKNSLFLSGVNSGTSSNIETDIFNEVYNVNDGVFGRAQISTDIFYKNVVMGPGNSFFTLAATPAPPTCPVSAGGSVPVGTQFYFLAPIYANGSEGTLSTSCAATTTTGNQTVTLSWSAIPGVAQYNLYRGVNNFSNVGPLNGSPIAALTYTDTAAVGPGGPFPQLASGGPAGMHANLVWAQIMQVGDRATITSGAGAPSGGACTTSTGGKIYLRTDGTTTTTLYVCDGAAGSWTAK